jgi:hypothetical protein
LDQLPLLTVRVVPTVGMPLTCGGVSVTSGEVVEEVTAAVDADVTDAEPPLFVAVTITATASPTSDACNVSVEPVAPATLLHPELVQSFHW